jgi:hypothetical protein
VDLRIHDFDSGREPVGQKATRFAFEDRQEGPRKAGISVIKVQCASQLALKVLGNTPHLIGIAYANHEAKGSKNLFSKHVIG